MRARIGDWLDERIGHREVLAQWQRPVAGGASFAHTLSFLVAFLLVIEAASGALLALYYAPSTSAAWASVAYIEDQVPLGAVVRGVHRWGMSAVVIVAGLHLVVTALRGGYRRPREVQWWIGLGLIGVITLYSVTGFVLRWDQYGYWATKVELAYVNDAPGPGRQLVQAVQGGNEFGNLTLTHFYALHAVVLPIVTLLLAWALRAQARRHGVLPTGGPARAAWPYQSLRNWVVAALALIALVAWSEHAGGAGLDGPADPTAAYDARPQWYFRPLFALVNTFGSLRTFMALGLPLVVFGVLAAVPLFDGRPGRPRRHYAVLAMLFVGLVGAIGVSMQSYAKDDDDQELQQRSHRFARGGASAAAQDQRRAVARRPGGVHDAALLRGADAVGQRVRELPRRRRSQGAGDWAGPGQPRAHPLAPARSVGAGALRHVEEDRRRRERDAQDRGRRRRPRRAGRAALRRDRRHRRRRRQGRAGQAAVRRRPVRRLPQPRRHRRLDRAQPRRLRIAPLLRGGAARQRGAQPVRQARRHAGLRRRPRAQPDPCDGRLPGVAAHRDPG
jgi:quinol-cytochrome oxidoreductase complex cytochrome b subunit